MFKCVFDISVSLSAKEKNKFSQKQKFDDVTFAMTLFWAKKSKNVSLLGEEKNS